MIEQFYEKSRITRMNDRNRDILANTEDILKEYHQQGYRLTLRQLYYQLVSRDLIPNSDKEYKNLSKIAKLGRMAGELDWYSIEDRLRVPKVPYYVENIYEAVNNTVSQYRLDRQKGQDTYIEVWVEKDALSSVLYKVTSKYQIRLMVNRGYSSVSAMYRAFDRFRDAMNIDDQFCTILYFGDHDPSGLDMVRDIRDRIDEFGETKDYERYGTLNYSDFSVIPIALTMEQIEKYNPPPNPAKITDPRAKWYIEKYGDVSWELDALTPSVLEKLLEDAINEIIDVEKYTDMINREDEDKNKLKKLMENF